MKEVSCKALGNFCAALIAKGIPLEKMVEGTDIAVATLRNKNERIDWSDFVVISRNLRRYFTDDEYVEIGRQHLRVPILRFVFIIARLRFTPMGFYRWFNTPREGVGNQLFTPIVPSQRELSEHELEVDLTVKEPYEVVRDFFVITRGNFEEMPRLLGLPPAQVTLTMLPRGGRYHITLPKKTPFLARIRRIVTWPFTVRAAARELQEAHETLRDRYEQLEDARTKLDRQATQLRTAHTINQLVQRDLDLRRTLVTVVHALVEEGGFSWAEIHLLDQTRGVSAGTKRDAEPLTRALGARSGQLLGHLAVIPQVDADRAERDAFLAFIVPSLAIALENASYRAGLERLVERRTTELQRARDELAGTVDQLREAQGARERFFGNISHEIRTPLSIIMLAAADIESRAGGLLDGRARAGLGAVTDAARKLVRLVDELLLLAAGQEGKLRTNPEPTDVAALVAQVAAAWRPAAELAGLQLAVRAPASLAANVDPVALERVATNLVSNAIKYTPRGGGVEIELADEPAGMRLSVLDTGPGIGEELAGRLFGRFERATGAVRRTEGTGLGLSLAKQLVEAHGGTIEAHARESGGTELRVVLPRALAIREVVTTPPVGLRLVEDAPAATSALASGSRLAPAGISKGTVLLAEDDARLAEMIARLLADDYVVLVAHDGATALELARRHQPHLLITDVDMPGITGIELSRRFRETTGDRLAPIVILSAILDLGTRVAGLEAGAVDYVTKPFDPLELKARVRSQFHMRELAVRLHRAEQLSTLGILTSGLAHELRNPANGVVNAISPLVELLPKELTAPDQAVGQLLEVIGSCAQQIGFLSRQLLGFRNGGIELELRGAKVRELISRSVSLAQGPLSGLEIRTQFSREGMLMCAPPLITQVLTNLIENAAHAAGRGGWVDLRVHAAGGTLTVEVSDSGPGVPVEHRERVFEPFFTTKPPGVGTGLGLSVAREIAHRHGGTLEIRDRDARPVFVLQLPGHSALDVTASAV